jgi:hypothetical protein
LQLYQASTKFIIIKNSKNEKTHRVGPNLSILKNIIIGTKVFSIFQITMTLNNVSTIFSQAKILYQSKQIIGKAIRLNNLKYANMCVMFA